MVILNRIDELTKEEIDKIGKYCECDACRYDKNYKNMSVLNPLKLLIKVVGHLVRPCECCCGCIKSLSPLDKYIHDARESYIKAMNKNKN